MTQMSYLMCYFLLINHSSAPTFPKPLILVLFLKELPNILPGKTYFGYLIHHYAEWLTYLEGVHLLITK